MEYLQLNHGRESLYTYVAIFHNYAQDFSTIIMAMARETSKYVSFEDFLRYFEVQAHPDLETDAQIELATISQKQNEDITQYYQRFVELTRIIGCNPDKQVLQFTEGLKSAKLRELAVTMPGTELTLEGVWRHVSASETRIRLLGVYHQGSSRRGNNDRRNVSNVDSGAGRGGKGRGKGGGGKVVGANGGGQSSSNVAVTSTVDGQSGGGEKGRGGRGGGRGGRGRGRGGRGGWGRGGAAAASVAAINDSADLDPDSEPYARFEAKSYAQWRKEIRDTFQTVGSKALLENRCLGCFQTGHYWTKRFNRCSEACHFCGTPHADADGHLVHECSSRPADLPAILQAIDYPSE